MIDINELEKIEKADFDSSGKFYSIDFRLNPQKMMSVNGLSLQWDSIQYKTGDENKIPDDKSGIYAFAIKCSNDTLPPNCYVVYVGIAGRRGSGRSLRQRYKDYLQTSQVRRRSRICRMISSWHSVLVFFFAPIDDNTIDLESLEKRVIDALHPPFCDGDYSSETKKARNAF